MATFVIAALLLLTMIITFASENWANDIVFKAIQAGLFVLLVQHGLDWWQMQFSARAGDEMLATDQSDSSSQHAFIHRVVINHWK